MPEREAPPAAPPKSPSNVADKDAAAQAIAAAMSQTTPVDIYANGFSLGMTNADVFMVLLRFGRPVGIVNVSYTLAKTLSNKLNALVEEWEKRTGQNLQTTDSIDEKWKDLK